MAKGKIADEKVLKWKKWLLSKKKKRATKQSTKKSCFWNYAPLFFQHYYFKNPI